MRLKQIKLAGFKSFVDPTTVPFPAQMTAIVGPNGCGKSNIIDAVRWVLGESSAKNLRGDAMTDVIFNGSSARKPVSQASIELIFDNSSGRLDGEYAKYNEIAVKRSVNRDPTAQYYLNGNKCRKKDITDLFLGTGLGPRSYSIIEQGMISRLIESKPQDLRLFIEEAAGISKYKERRRETENRIRHTRENLERLEDVISELQQQLEKLQRQAAAAKRYKDLKQKERQYKAELNVLKWQRLSAQADQLNGKINQLELELEQLMSSQRGDENRLNQLKIEQFQARQKVEDITQTLFKHAQEISRAEQNLVHLKAQKTQLIQQQNKNVSELNQLQDEIRLGELNLAQSQQALVELEPELEFCHQTLAELEHNIILAEQTYNQANQLWSEQSKHFYQVQTQLSSQQQSYQAIEQKLISEKQRLDVSKSRFTNLTQQQQSGHLEQISEEKSIAQARFEAIQEQITQTQDQLQTDLSNGRTKQRQLQQLTGELQKLDGQIASLNLLITKQTKQNHGEINQWLNQHNILQPDELFQKIEVEPNWELALETVLGNWQKALLTEHSLPLLAEQAPPQTLYLVSQDDALNLASKSFELTDASQHASLAEKINAPKAIKTMLAHIAAVDDEQSYNQVAELINSAEQTQFSSVINPKGNWYGRGWQVFSAQEQDNIFALKQELEQLYQATNVLQQQIDDLEQALELNQQNTQQLEQTLAEKNQNLQQTQQALFSLQSRYDSEKNKINYQQEQQIQLEQDIENIEVSIEMDSEKLLDLEAEIELTSQKLAEFEDNHQANETNKQAAQHKLSDLQKQRENQQQLEYQSKLKLEQARHQIQTHQVKQDNYQQKLTEIIQDQEEIAEKLVEIEMPLETEQQNAQLLIEQKAQAELQKTEFADKLAEVELLLAEIEKGQHGLFSKQQNLKDEINRLQLEQEGFRVRARSVLEVLNDLNTSLKQVLETLDENAEETLWQQELDKTTQAINRLGAINLAAIEEYEHQAERKHYLDAQHQDLISALTTLEDAIRKIDRETKSRFRDTFEAVNQDLQQLFPKVFGGGAAWLELTDDDLLETGVTIMARPPGKRNSTIHLLSGGEKALTALSLVFAIFRLNPAPFCMLDEVDAPLDDANVGRFCRLVQEMSSSVQFIFISHNKIAMEMATHLVGVTMQEPGVSRMVAVDIDKAIELAELG
ncbi:chromosome segregation protein SMC [Catenovulum sp. 2E275]|uniref:chromosome segregation protein SMC n=1 Tax=Catenovulum sp. 2E275 TaxID=2980497 RepID=UPI0021D08513|nr:chromosome segregation protein SMC [Catenovulum sp. 2E275]MCU4676144.1 chromosome segregation protein SMC [Catenovulum sp. 2E275]